MAGVYANFANVTFSEYEFTITFARIDHEVEEGDVPGVVVSRVNMSQRSCRSCSTRCRTRGRSDLTNEGIQEPPRSAAARLAATRSTRDRDALPIVGCF